MGEETIVDYNDEPVFFCTKCLSLRIRSISGLEDSEYCDDCGSTNIDKCDIFEWENKYKALYRRRYIETY